MTTTTPSSHQEQPTIFVTPTEEAQAIGFRAFKKSEGDLFEAKRAIVEYLSQYGISEAGIATVVSNTLQAIAKTVAETEL